MSSGKILWGNVFCGGGGMFLMRREDAREMSILLTANPGHVSHFSCVTVWWQEKLQQCCIQRARLIFLYSWQTIPLISEILQASAQTTKPPVSVLIFMRWKKCTYVKHCYTHTYMCIYACTHIYAYICVCVRITVFVGKTDETMLSQYLLYSKDFIVWAWASITVWLLARLTSYHLMFIIPNLTNFV